MEEITVYAAMALFSQKRYEICAIRCGIIPNNGMYKILDKELTIPKDRTKNATAIAPQMMHKRIYLNQSSNVNFVYYSLDRDECLLELMNCKKDYFNLQNSLIEQRQKEIDDLQKKIDKYKKRMETFDETFVIKPVDDLRNWQE